MRPKKGAIFMQKEVPEMPEVIISDYFYGDEAEMFQYFRIPKQLITDERFKGVSTDAKLLYGMLLDRMSLSVKNQWFDKDGRVYIYYTVEEICEDMTCGRDKAMKLLAELDKGKRIGLIERIRQGQGQAHEDIRQTLHHTRHPAYFRGRKFRRAEVGFSDLKKSG